MSGSADQNLDPSPESTIRKVNRTIATNIKVNSGDSFTLRGITDEYEFARVDYLEFVPVEDAVSSDWDSFSGGSGGSQSGYFKFFDNVISAIATHLGIGAEDVLNNRQNNYSSTTEERFSDIFNDILFSNGWGSWGSGGSGSGGGGWGGGSSGSCGWGCQAFEELFHSHSFGAVISDDHEHEGHEDHIDAHILDESYADTLTGKRNRRANAEVSRAAKHDGTNHSRTGHRGLKKNAYASQGFFNQYNSDKISESIKDLQKYFSSSTGNLDSLNSNQRFFDFSDNFTTHRNSLYSEDHLLLNNSADIISALL